MAFVLSRPARLLLVVLLGIFSLAHFSHAALPCGDIVAPEYFFGTSHLSSLINVSIDNCADPFAVTSQTAPYVLKINDIEISNGQTAYLAPEQTPNIQVLGQPTLTDYQIFLFRHDADNYQFVELYPETDEGLILDIDTYTIVIQEYDISVSQHSPLQRFINFFIPVAYAQIVPIIYTITFNVAEPPLEPTGASSILFLPGIMGSRLYEESEVCGSETDEKERWVSFDDCDQLRLQTNYLGQSLNTIYTYATESALVDEIAAAFGQGPNIYKSFLSDLNDWKEEELIADYIAVPYDWRLRIDDLMKLSRNPVTNKVTLDSDVPLNLSYLYETISRLAQDSNTEKVTVVAHSNGGLVIKYFLKILEENNDPLLERIDNVILVAVPQEGTPESVIGSLHGVKLGVGGIVMGSEVSRKLLKDAPFGFHLLPTQQYFDSVITPVIQIEEGVYTNAWRTQFGENIDSYNKFRNFMVIESGRPNASSSDLLTPAILNSYAFTYKSQLAEKLANWEAPEGIRIYQVAGTGLDTPSGITYFTDIACVEESFFSCIHYERKLGYRITTVLDGDGTVVTPSALSMSESGEVERWWVNLEDYNKTEIDRLHRDILEVEDVRNFVFAVAAPSSDSTYNYLSNDSPELGTGERLIFQLHSPLDMYVILSDGKVVGSSTELVRGAYYRRFGEVQYLSIPASETNYVVYLSGQSKGSFSLDVEKYTGNLLDERFTYSAVPSTASTKVEFSVTSTEAINSETSLPVDYDGDGVVDVEVAIWPYGDILPVVPPAATTTPVVVEERRNSSSGTRVVFSTVLPAPLVLGVTGISGVTQIELMQQLIILLEEYRDLLIILNSHEV